MFNVRTVDGQLYKPVVPLKLKDDDDGSNFSGV